MKPKNPHFLLIVLYAITISSLPATPVMFPLKSFFNGANYTRPITITAVHPTLTDGTNLYAGSFINLTPTGLTNPVLNLAPNDYTITFADVRTPLRFSVPESSMPLSVLILITNGLTSYYPTVIGGGAGNTNALNSHQNTLLTNSVQNGQSGALLDQPLITTALVMTNGPLFLRGTAYLESESGLMGIYPNGAFTLGSLVYDPLLNVLNLNGAIIAGLPTYAAASGGIWQVLAPDGSIVVDNTDRSWLDAYKSNLPYTNGSPIVNLGTLAHSPNGANWFANFAGKFTGDASALTNNNIFDITNAPGFWAAAPAGSGSNPNALTNRDSRPWTNNSGIYGNAGGLTNIPATGIIGTLNGTLGTITLVGTMTGGTLSGATLGGATTIANGGTLSLSGGAGVTFGSGFGFSGAPAGNGYGLTNLNVGSISNAVVLKITNVPTAGQFLSAVDSTGTVAWVSSSIGSTGSGINLSGIIWTNFNCTHFSGYLPIATNAGVVQYLLFSSNVPGTSATLYSLTVSNGTGSGSYVAGASVSISTNATGFTNWSQVALGLIANINLASTALTMPNSNVWVSANYVSSGGIGSSLVLTNGLLIQWGMKDGSGSTATNGVVGGDSCALTGSPTWVGGGLTFASASSQRGYDGPSGTLIGAYPLTVSAWVTPTTTNGWQYYASYGCNYNQNDFAIGITNGLPFMEIYAAGSAWGFLPGTTHLTPGTRYLITAVFADQTHRTLYVNGVQDASEVGVWCDPTWGYYNSINVAGLYSGTWRGSADATIRDVRFWNIALSSGNVTTLNSTAPQ